VELRQQRRRVAAHRVRQHEHAAAFGHGRPDVLPKLGPEIRTLTLALEAERRHDQPLASHREHGDCWLALDLAALGQDAGPAAAEDDRRAGHAADDLQRLAGARMGIAGDEHECDVGAVRSTSLEGVRGRLARENVNHAPDGEPGARGDHVWTVSSRLPLSPRRD
jgi:hypothetical protein